MKQVNVVIKTLFHGISDDKINDTLEIFWSEYKYFINNNGPFDGDYFIWNSKDILQGNIHIWYHKYSIPYKKVLGFVACMVTSKIPGIDAAERSWDDDKTIKSGRG